jgi:hypothetical protein
MAKSRKHMHKKRNGKRGKRVMKGGDFTQEQKTSLQNSGFYPGQIERFELMGLTFDQVNQKVQEIMGEDFHGNSDDLAEAVEQALDAEHMDQGIPQAHDDEHNMDLNESFGSHDGSQGSLHMSHLDASQDSNASGYTTDEDMSFDVGGRKKRRTMKKRKGRKTMKKRKGSKTRKQHRRRQRGGTCYGNGVGANNYDPSFSIYNTRELTLFPYKPTN